MPQRSQVRTTAVWSPLLLTAYHRHTVRVPGDPHRAGPFGGWDVRMVQGGIEKLCPGSGAGD
ncbi:hypothetical protein [Streptomyces longispororuber]|uniref:hypothetical protein n=1 Tax=Streptomyces longispororuber TaxID=68230 RepID=UPI00167D1D3C|nr:hypothetical protein [Streptomyces longispororuber]